MTTNHQLSTDTSRTANYDVTPSAVSRAPRSKLQAYKRRMGWTFPWASSLDSDFNFNFDFNVSFSEEQQREGGLEYNYRREAALEWRAGEEGGGKERKPSSRPCVEPTRPPTTAIGRE